MKLIIDSAIPYIKGVFEPYAEVIYKKGINITPQDTLSCDGMIIRTRTKCNETLLEGSNVKFIGSATIGFDHIDLDYCQSKGISVHTAAGCNAYGVVQYVLAAMSSLKEKGYNISPQKTTIGIIGVGNVGGALAKTLRNMGFRLLLNDPPRQRINKDIESVDLKTLLEKSDIVTLHTPLIKSGEDKTYGLADKDFFTAMGDKGTIFINASRGEVVCESALKEAIVDRTVSEAVIDVWCGEPIIDKTLCRDVFISTPHIAGYSVQGKANGTAMMVNATAEFFGIDDLKQWYPQGVERDVRCIDKIFDDVCAQMVDYYDILADNERLKETPDLFEDLRNNYTYREEFF